MPNNDINLNMKTTGAAQTQSAVNGVASSLKKLAVAYLGYRTVAGAVKFFAGTVKAYVDQKNATDQLSISIGKNAQVYATWAEKIQQITKQTDDQILSMMRLASTFGVGEEKLQQTTKAAIGLGRALGLDAAGALRLLTKAETGSFMQLQRYLPILKTFTTTREKLAFVMSKAALGWKMEKQAAADSPWELMKKSIGELNKTIGKELFSSVKSVTTALNVMLKSDNAQAFAAAIGKSVNSLLGLVGVGNLSDTLGRVRFGENAGKERKRALGASRIAAQEKLVADLEKQAANKDAGGTGVVFELRAAKEKLDAMHAKMQPLGDVSKDLTEEWPNKITEIVDGLKQTFSAENLARWKQNLDAFSDAVSLSAAAFHGITSSTATVGRVLGEWSAGVEKWIMDKTDELRAKSAKEGRPTDAPQQGATGSQNFARNMVDWMSYGSAAEPEWVGVIDAKITDARNATRSFVASVIDYLEESTGVSLDGAEKILQLQKQLPKE